MHRNPVSLETRDSWLHLKKLRWLLALVFSFTLCFSTQVAEVLADAPTTCQVGVYVTALRNFKLTEKTFDAEFRLWSVCPTDTFQPLKNIKIVGGTTPIVSYENFSVKDNVSTTTFASRDKVYYHQQEMSATIGQSWNVDNYPFDRHVLKIQLEDGMQNSVQFVYTPDLTASGYQKSMNLGAWKIKNFKMEEIQVPYATNFGDPSTNQKSQSRSRLVVSVSIYRDKALSFFKLVAGVYAAVAMTALTFFLDTNIPPIFSGRMGLLVGVLFAIVVNMRVVESAIGRTETVTLADFIHIVAVAYVFIAAVLAVYSRIQSASGFVRLAKKTDTKVFFPIFVISFIVINIIAVSYAAFV